MTAEEDGDVDHWLAIGEGLLRTLPISKKQLRAQFDARLTQPYLRGVQESLTVAGFDEQEQARRIGLHRTTRRRHEAQAHVASLATLAALINVFELQPQELRFPDHLEVAVQTIRETVEEVQAILRGRPSIIDPLDLLRLKLAIASQEWFEACCEEDAERAEQRKRKEAQRIASMAERLLRGVEPGNFSEQDYQQYLCLIDEWGDAFAIFRVVVPYQWGW